MGPGDLDKPAEQREKESKEAHKKQKEKDKKAAKEAEEWKKNNKQDKGTGLQGPGSVTGDRQKDAEKQQKAEKKEKKKRKDEKKKAKNETDKEKKERKKRNKENAPGQQKTQAERDKEEEEADRGKDDKGTMKDRPNGGNPQANEIIGEGANNMWVLYAQMIMADSVKPVEDNQKAKDDKDSSWKWNKKAKANIVGDDGVRLSTPFNKMEATSQALNAKDGDQADEQEQRKGGKYLASFLGTANNYNYIQTLSGNKIAAGANNFGASIFRHIGGFFALIALFLYELAHKASGYLSTALAKFNPYYLLGFGDGKPFTLGDKDKNNPIAEGITQAVNKLGLNGDVFAAIAEIGFAIILGILGLAVIYRFARADLKGGMGHLGKWMVRAFVIFCMFPLMGMIAAGVIKFLNFDGSDESLKPIARQHIVDVRGWAATQNLAPSGINGDGRKPTATAKENWVDEDFNPNRGKKNRNMIGLINSNTKQSLIGSDEETEWDYDRNLIKRWTDNDDFDVDDYIADVRQASDDLGEPVQGGNLLLGADQFPTKYADNKKPSKKPDHRSLEFYMWSGTPNIEDSKDASTRNPKDKHFNPINNLGVYNNESFSTQSVVLLLQSGINSTGTDFYAKHITPEGLQGNAKNWVSYQTKWKSTSLAGAKGLGQIASWLSLVSKSIMLLLITTACFLALLTTGLMSAMIKFIKQIFRALIRGSINSAMATFAIFAGVLGSAWLVVKIPFYFVEIVMIFSDLFNSAFNATLNQQGMISDDMLSILIDVLCVFLAYYISFGGRVGPNNETPVRLITMLPTKIALGFEERVAELDRQGEFNIGRSVSTGSRIMGGQTKGATSAISKGASSSMRGKVDSAKGATKRQAGGAFGASKGAIAGGAMGAIKSGVATGGTGAIAGAAKGAAKGAGKGYSHGKAGKKGLYKSLHNDTSKDSQNAKSSKESMKRNGYSNPRDAAKASAVNAEDLAKGVNSMDKEGKSMSQGLIVPPDQFGGSGRKSLDGAKSSKKDVKEFYGDNPEHDQRVKQSGQAAEAAKNAVNGDNEAMFTKSEIDDLRNTDGEDEYAHALKGTTHGTEYAMQTESAKEALQDTDFVNEAGHIDQGSINDFEKELDEKQVNGTATEDDYAKKAQLDSAFVMGAKEHFRNANRPGAQVPNRQSSKASKVSGAKSSGAKAPSQKGATGSPLATGMTPKQSMEANQKRKAQQSQVSGGKLDPSKSAKKKSRGRRNIRRGVSKSEGKGTKIARVKQAKQARRKQAEQNNKAKTKQAKRPPKRQAQVRKKQNRNQKSTKQTNARRRRSGSQQTRKAQSQVKRPPRQQKKARPQKMMNRTNQKKRTRPKVNRAQRPNQSASQRINRR